MAEAPMNRAELARHYGVHPATVTRLLEAAARDHARDPQRYPPPPSPENPGSHHPVWLLSTFDPLWRSRRRRGRPPTENPE